MRRLPWDIVLALLIGLGLGLVYAWMIAPRGITQAEPTALRADFKDHYRSAIAAAYAATGNLPRARLRLSLLGEPDPIAGLNAQAQRMLANSEPFQQTDQMAALALALEGAAVPTSQPATEAGGIVEEIVTATPPSASIEAGIDLTETALAPLTTFLDETQPVEPTDTPRPTQTSSPTPGIPFALTGEEEVCDANLPEGLLQVVVLNSNRRQLPGMAINITWDGNGEQFFTGLKPELGNGYADFLMAPNIFYTVELAAGSEVAAGLLVPTCQEQNGETFLGGIKLTFQQP